MPRFAQRGDVILSQLPMPSTGLTQFKLTRLVMIIGVLLVLVACGPDYRATATAYRATATAEANDRAIAWAACKSVIGHPSGRKVSGKPLAVATQDGGALEDLGDNSYLAYAACAHRLTEASVVVCATLTSKLYADCRYPNAANVRYTLHLYSQEALATVLAWPSRELIAQTTLKSKTSCPFSVTYAQGATEGRRYDHVDLKGWLGQYVIGP
jgi:hypothetical protein